MDGPELFSFATEHLTGQTSETQVCETQMETTHAMH